MEKRKKVEVSFVTESELQKHIDELWEIIVNSYQNIGGIKTYKNKEDFIRKAKYAKIVYNNDRIIACAIYRRIEGSYKMVAIGCNQEVDGKEALQAIIKNDIAIMNMHFGVEVSGAIEHYFKKYNGYLVPNDFVAEILVMPQSNIIKSTQDKVHYERLIGGEMMEKMIFGMKSQELFDKVISSVENYGTFMKEVNNLNESSGKYTVQQAIYVIENIYRAYEEDGYNELIPSWYTALNEALKTLTQTTNKTETINDYIEYANYLLSNMTVLRLNRLS